MMPSEWIARRTIWGSLGPPPTVNGSRGVPPDADGRSGGSEVTRPNGGNTVSHLFGARAINDGAGMINLDVPHIVSREAPVPISIQVNWPLVLTKAVACLYLIADGNRDPLLASIPLVPDVVPPHVCVNIRLDDTTDVRAIVECGDGTLLQVKRWVWVLPPVEAPGLGAPSP